MMGNQTIKVIIGVSVGVALGILFAICGYITARLYRKKSQVQHRSTEFGPTLPIHANGSNTSVDSSESCSYSEVGLTFQHQRPRGSYWGQRGIKDKSLSSSGIPIYLHKEIQKATQNFTTLLGQGSFGPVYKATLPTSEVVAVKALANNSRQGEREFQTEVLLLSRLHHRNLVNLLGYCVDKGQHMLIYEFMSNGSLENLLYGNGPRSLTWEERLQIAHDVSHGIEYLHEGATPPVVHRDLKSANILLDKSMRAKVADFGLSKEDICDGRKSGLKGTYGYMDPDYMSTSKFTKKSDIYSFGIILFELITVINPQQGLTDYINLAVIGGDGKADWEQIMDKKLAGESNAEEVRLLADIAYKCLDKNPRKRPSITDVTVAISRIRQLSFARADTLVPVGSDTSGVLRRIEHQQVELTNITSRRESMSSRI